MSKFTVAGVSRSKGKVKVRFCSDLVLRIKNLQKQGDEDIQLIELPSAMTKSETCQYLLSLETFKPFAAEISEILGKKVLNETKKQPTIKAATVETDPEIETIKELAVA